MKISAVNDAGSLFFVQVDDGNINSLKNGLASLMGIPASDQMLLLNGQELTTISHLTENDLVLVRQKQITAMQRHSGTVIFFCNILELSWNVL
jgi:hypothetical protein